MKLFLLFIGFIFSLSMSSQTVLHMERNNGVYYVPCKINGVPLNFIFDTGASDVSISLTEASFMIKNGFLKKEDLGESVYYSVANGTIGKGTKLNIKEIEIGGLKLFNIQASIIHETDAPLLLGQSVIERLGKIQLEGNQLTILNGVDTSYDYSGSSKIQNATNVNDYIYNKKIDIENLLKRGVMTSSGLVYKITYSTSGRKPKDGENVYIHYSGYLENGKLFDSSVEQISRNFGLFDQSRFDQNGYLPFPYKIGSGGLISGFQEALSLMSVNDKMVVYIPSNLAYGKNGAGKVIPPNANLIFEFQLLER
jgi:clan AA aspartic protease (TIGR02281 family)